ncbi:hypothetical protein R41_25 [Klebsiella phage R4_1]|nr:hypothetical protein R41_25 [Klebsiella phage R4_1]
MKNLFTVPAWIDHKGDYDFINFFEVMALLNIENQWVRMTADDQRKLFGVALFGKKQFMVKSSGEVMVCWSTCFGTDSETVTINRENLKEAINHKKALVL